MTSSTVPRSEWGSPAGAGIDPILSTSPLERFPRTIDREVFMSESSRFPRRRGDRPVVWATLEVLLEGSPAGAGIDLSQEPLTGRCSSPVPPQARG